MTPGVVDLALQAMPRPHEGGELQAVVIAAGSGRELGHRGKPGISRLSVREWSKAAWTCGLKTVHLGHIRLVYGARAHVLRLEAGCGSKLMFQTKTPLHEIGSVELAIRNGRNNHREQAGCLIGGGRCAGKPSL